MIYYNEAYSDANNRSFFCFYWVFFCNLPANISYSVCESTLFKTTFEVPLCKKTFLDWKSNKKHCIFLKTTFPIHYFDTFISYKESSWAGGCFQLWEIWFMFLVHNQQTFKKSHQLLGLLFHCFNLLFSKYVLKILANIFSLLQNWLKVWIMCQKTTFLLTTFKNVFKWLCTCMHNKYWITLRFLKASFVLLLAMLSVVHNKNKYF